MVLLPLAITFLILFFSDSHFTLWIYQTVAAVFLVSMLAGLAGEFNRRTRYVVYAVVACLALGGTYFFGLETLFFVVALLLGAGFILGGVAAMSELINPQPGAGSVLTVMFLMAPIALVVGCYYFAIGYQGLGLDAYLSLADYIPLLRA